MPHADRERIGVAHEHRARRPRAAASSWSFWPLGHRDQLVGRVHASSSIAGGGRPATTAAARSAASFAIAQRRAVAPAPTA